MKQHTQVANQPQNKKKASAKPSITGGVLAVLALISSGIANILVRLESTPSGSATNQVEEVGGAVAEGTATALFAILSMPFLAVGGLLGVLAIVFTVLRLRSVKSAGMALSILWIVLAVWAIWVAFGVLDIIKADPQV